MLLLVLFNSAFKLQENKIEHNYYTGEFTPMWRRNHSLVLENGDVVLHMCVIGKLSYVYDFCVGELSNKMAVLLYWTIVIWCEFLP